jgi:very-short-patch-repair endonuclease
MAEINEADVRRLYLERGLSMRKVAEAVGAPLATLSRFMKKAGIAARDKAQAQKNFLKDNDHQMKGRKHSDETKKKISHSLGDFWDDLSDEEREEFKRKIGSAWQRKWAGMSEVERKLMMEGLSNKAKEAQGKGSRLERFITEELRGRGYLVEERSTHYTGGKDFEVDLALPNEMIALEVDGPTHFLPIYGDEHLEQQQERDARKDEMINAVGYSVLRVRDNNGPLSQLRIDKIEQAIEEIKQDGRTSVWYVEQA